MKSRKLSNLLEPEKKELSALRKLYRETQRQIDESVEQGNDALLTLKDEYDELAEKKRELLRDIEKIEDRLKEVKDKLSYAENTYGEYLKAIKGGKENEI